MRTDTPTYPLPPSPPSPRQCLKFDNATNKTFFSRSVQVWMQRSKDSSMDAIFTHIPLHYYCKLLDIKLQHSSNCAADKSQTNTKHKQNTNTKNKANTVSLTKSPVPCLAGVMVPGRGVAPEVAPGLEKNRWREGKRLVPGEVEIGDSQWAHRQKELLNRRLYLKDFWYAAGKGDCRFDSHSPSCMPVAGEVWWAALVCGGSVA